MMVCICSTWSATQKDLGKDISQTFSSHLHSLQPPALKWEVKVIFESQSNFLVGIIFSSLMEGQLLIVDLY